MQDKADKLNLGCIPPEKKHLCPRCQELLPMDEVLKFSYSSYPLLLLLYYFRDFIDMFLVVGFLFPFTCVCSLQCTKCREQIHVWRWWGLWRKAAFSEYCGKRVPAVGWMTIHFGLILLATYYIVTTRVCFASWDSFKADCDLEAQSSDYQRAINVFHSRYYHKAVFWHGISHSGWYLGETSLPFPEDFEVCVGAMMNFRSPPGADVLYCLSKKSFQDVNATVPIGATVRFAGHPEFTWNSTRLPCIRFRWEHSKVVHNKTFYRPSLKNLFG